MFINQNEPSVSQGSSSSLSIARVVLVTDSCDVTNVPTIKSNKCSDQKLTNYSHICGITIYVCACVCVRACLFLARQQQHFACIIIYFRSTSKIKGSSGDGSSPHAESHTTRQLNFTSSWQLCIWWVVAYSQRSPSLSLSSYFFVTKRKL